jgi:hypothetical protein
VALRMLKISPRLLVLDGPGEIQSRISEFRRQLSPTSSRSRRLDLLWNQCPLPFFLPTWSSTFRVMYPPHFLFHYSPSEWAFFAGVAAVWFLVDLAIAMALLGHDYRESPVPGMFGHPHRDSNSHPYESADDGHNAFNDPGCDITDYLELKIWAGTIETCQ